VSQKKTGLDNLQQSLINHLEFYSELGVTHLQIEKKSADSRIENQLNTTVNLVNVQKELGDCTRCKLHTTRKNIVFGVGNSDANLMFVGEAPGHDEDVQGEPFVGRAGQLLTKIIQAIEFEREDVYIANILKCRPPNNRNPEPDEIEVCEPFLFKQIEAIKPRILVALGKYAAQTLLQTKEPISRIRGRYFDYRGLLLMPTFHPSYLLRSPSAKRFVWADMQKVRDTLREMSDDM